MLRILFTVLALASIFTLTSQYVFAENSHNPRESAHSRHSRHNQTLNISTSMFLMGTDLNKRLYSDKNNIVLSPLSIHLALDMVLTGSVGKTRGAVATALKIPISEDPKNIKESARSLMNSLMEDKDVTLNIANSIWIKKNFKVKNSFLKDCQKYFSAEARNEINAKEINDWVSSKTNAKIKEIITQQVADSADLVLLNAVYFYGTWHKTFDANLTEKQKFMLDGNKSIMAPTMRQKSNFEYFETKDFQAVRLPYKGNKLAMYVFLPSKDSSLKKFMSTFSDKAWNDVLQNSTPEEVEISLPKFKLEYEETLNKTLASMGMDIAFSPAANFGLISQDRIYISLVKHKTYIDVNEKGTEAAAATSIVMTKSIKIQNEPKIFKVDRPFYFIIAHEDANTPLFMGTIVNPEK